MFISVIIPVYKEAKINHVIDNIFNQNYKNFEILIIDGDTSKTTIVKINSEKYNNLKMIVTEKGRAVQMNKGAEIANGDILLFLHADSELPENGLEEIRNFISNNTNYAGGAFSLKINSNNLFLKVISFLTTIRSKLTKVPYGDQGIFIRKNIFTELGGYKNLPLLEDVDLMERLKKHNFIIKIMNNKILTSSRKWKKKGLFKNTCKNRIIMLLYSFGVTPAKIKKFLF